MRRLLRHLRSGLDARVQAWLRRRQGLDRDPLQLDRRRVYILPTRLGTAYAAMLFAMVVGGLNYSNNLGLGFAFLLVSLGLVTMHHCHGAIAGLRLRLVATEPAFAGQPVGFELLLENPSGAPRPGIELSIGRDVQRSIDVPGLASAPALLQVPAERRGRVRLERFVLATRHPLGLFRAWAVVHPEYSAIAWPRPAARGRTPPGVETDTGGAQDRSPGEEDFAGLKPYQAGDSTRRIAWGAYARGQGLHTKQYAGTDVVSHIFDYDALTGIDVESRLALLCRWVLDAHDRGEAFGLRLPGLEIEANLGTAHRQRCLTALGLFEPAGKRG
jgi:uncharacterized protein (DUF58 family)